MVYSDHDFRKHKNEVLEDIHCGLRRPEMVQKKETPQICQSWIDRPLALQRASYFSSNWSIQVMETPISWAMKTKQLSLFCFCGQKSI